MPTYAYRCRECTDTFEVNRPMSESSTPATCPEGHTDTVKLLTTVALTGSGAPRAGGGGGAGGARRRAVRRRLLRRRLRLRQLTSRRAGPTGRPGPGHDAV
jgi:putative FmdB family regulatory protein